jgi:hypothetical protein
MANSTEKLALQKITEPTRNVVFFVLFFLYLWLKVDLRFIIHCGGIVSNLPVFYLDWAFLQDHLSYPGRPIEYVTAFLAQLWYIGWLGALIATIAAWLIFICTDTIIRLINAPYIRFTRFVVPILLLAIYTRYTYHFDTAVSLLVALSFVVLYLKISCKQKRFSHPIIFLVLSAVLYYLGGKSFSLFAVICGIYELFFNRQIKMGLLCLFLAGGVPYLIEGHIFHVGWYDTFIRQMPIPLSEQLPMTPVVYILYFMLPLAMILSFLCHAVSGNIKTRFKPSIPAKVTLAEIFKTTVLFTAAALSIYFSNEPSVTVVLKSDYYACRKMWPEVIETVRSYPTTGFAVHMADRAMYHTGRLAYDMCTLPQDPKILFMNPDISVGSGYGPTGLWQRFGTYMDLGRMNQAEYELYNILEIYGERPVLLENLAMIKMAKGDYNTARVYLKTLTKTLFHTDWANKYLEKLKSDPALERDGKVRQMRRVMLAIHYDSSTIGTDEITLDLLATNRHNHMAFEYLMATYLLQRRPGLDHFINNLYRLKDFYYAEMPRLYEEAVLVYMYETSKTVDLYGFQISPESVQRHDNFAESIQKHGGLKAARGYMAKNFGDSYMFYYLYGESGVKK